jgi:hypothetical protein
LDCRFWISADSASCAVLPLIAVVPEVAAEVVFAAVVLGELLSAWTRARTASSAVVPVGDGGCKYCASCCSLTLPVLLGSSAA